MEIRDASLEDFPGIVEIYNSTVPSSMVTADPEPISVESRREWFSDHDPEKRPLWVAEVDGEMAGWFSFERFRKKPAYRATAEVSVYVAEKHRRKGVGRRLLAEAIRRSPRFGFEKWAHYPRVAELDGIERDLVVLGLRLDAEGR